MQWPLGTSVSLIPKLSDEDFEACRRAGVRYLEMGIPRRGFDLSSDEDLARLGTRAASIQQHELELWSVHLPYGRQWDIAAKDPALRKRVLEVQAALIAHAAAWGARVAVVHPGAEPIAAVERDAAIGRSVDALSRLAEEARRHGIRLAAECLPRTCLGNTSAELLYLVEQAGGVDVCFDANHLLQEKPEDFVARLGGRIVTVHISDHDGVDERHWLPGRGVIDWTAVINRLREADYRGPFLFEVSQRNAERPIRPDDLARCAHRLWAEAVGAVSGTG